VDFVLVIPTAGIERIGGEAAWRVIASTKLADGWVISGGAGNDISFELELIGRFGAKVHLFDPSPTGAATISRVQPCAGLWFHPVGLAGQDGDIAFGRPENSAEGSYRFVAGSGTKALSFACRRLSTWLRERGVDKISLLKIDIEGLEYEVLPDLIAAGYQPRQIAVEFHHFMPGFSRVLPVF